jgi:hypothetical protein
MGVNKKGTRKFRYPGYLPDITYIIFFEPKIFPGFSPRWPRCLHSQLEIKPRRNIRMHRLKEEMAAFLATKENRTTEARQIAAVQLACHIDLSGALESDAATRARIVVDLKRKIERERLRGTRGHWSYDINRHIALKQALERLAPPDADGKYFAGKKKPHRCRALPKQKSGAIGRRFATQQ